MQDMVIFCFGEFYMARKRGNDGRYIEGASGARSVQITFRLTSENKEKLTDIAKKRGLERSDLFDQWIANGCPTSHRVSFDKVKQKLVNVFTSKFAHKHNVGVQASICKDVRKLLLSAIREVAPKE